MSPQINVPVKPSRSDSDGVYSEIVEIDTNPSNSDSEIRIFDDLSKQLFTDFDILNACNNWGTWPMTLYKEAHRLSFDRVKATVRDVNQAKGIRDRGAYLRTILRRMGSQDTLQNVTCTRQMNHV